MRARGEHGGEVVGGEGRGLPPAPVGGRAAVARHHPRGAFTGGRGLPGELGPEVRGFDGLRGGAGGAARLEHVGDVLEAFVEIQTTLERLGEDMRRITGAAP